MVRLTTDNQTDNIEASLNLFYVRDGDAFIRGGGDAPDYADISVTDFIRKAARTLCPDMLLPESAEGISFAMAEYLFDGYEEPSGLIALLYTAAWSYAELRERLKAYEDTGLSPEKVSWMKEVVEAAFDNDTSRIERAHNLHVADKEGRVTILPCRGDADIVLMRDGVAFKPDHWNIHLTTFAENQPTPSGKKVALLDLREVRELIEGMKEL